MSEPLPDPGVFFEINSFEPLQNYGQVLAEWLDDARRLLIAPLVKSLAPATFRVTLASTTLAGVDQVGVPFAPIRWERLLASIRDGGLCRLTLLVRQLDEDGVISLTLPPIKLEMDLTGIEHAGAAHRLSFVAGRSLYGAGLPRDQQELLVAMAKRAALAHRASYGYITLDYAAKESPYETSIGRTSLWGLKQCGQFARGYYWGNFLSGQHIERLGGLSAVRRDAPCTVVEELANNPLLVYLQLSDDLDSFGDDQLRELWKYLLPVLPQTERVPSVTGWPLRIVHGSGP